MCVPPVGLPLIHHFQRLDMKGPRSSWHRSHHAHTGTLRAWHGPGSKRSTGFSTRDRDSVTLESLDRYGRCLTPVEPTPGPYFSITVNSTVFSTSVLSGVWSPCTSSSSILCLPGFTPANTKTLDAVWIVLYGFSSS